MIPPKQRVFTNIGKNFAETLQFEDLDFFYLLVWEVVLIVQQGGPNCPTRWSQLSDKVVLTVRQNLAIRVIGTTLSGKQDHFRLKQGGPNSLNKWSHSLTVPILRLTLIKLYSKSIFLTQLQKCLPSVVVEQTYIFVHPHPLTDYKKACRAGCSRRPFPMQVYQQSKSTHSAILMPFRI